MSDPGTHSDDRADLQSDDVSRAYRAAARDEPREELDDAICAAARRGVGSRRGRGGRPAMQRWGFPIAIAATVVVGISVAFLASDRSDTATQSIATGPGTRAGDAARSLAPAESPGRNAEPAPRTGMLADSQTAAAEARGQPPVAAARETRPSRERTTRDELVSKRGAAPQPSATPTPSADAVPDTARGAPAATVPQSAPPAGAPAAPGEVQSLRKATPRTEVQADQDAEVLSPEMWLQR
ncbi:MAG: hypothetical protein ABWY12_07215, partial [Burkholderiales bacterium]